MRISLKVTICFMTACVSLLSVTGNKGGPANINCVNKPVNQTAHVGGSVTINCNYSRAEKSNIRYFCRGYENLNCSNMISTHNANFTKLDRFSLTDNKQQRVYTVNLSRLTQADTGRYQCTIKNLTNSFTACLTEVHLHILNWDDVKPIEILGVTGKNAQIMCFYSDSHKDKDKFLCKGGNPFNCEELINKRKEDSGGRFTIRDNLRLKYFYVYIKNLSIADSGTYWCSDKTFQHAGYTKIHLSVAEKHPKRKELGISVLRDDGEQEKRPSDTAVIVGVAVSLALLVIAVVVLILCRHKLPRTQECCTAGGSSEQRTNAGNNTEGNHGEIQVQNQQANSGNTLPSIYDTINLPADQAHYASINFQKDSVGFSTNTLPDTNKYDSSCNYSSITWTQGTTNPLAAEQTLYSTLTKPGEP